MLKKVTFNTAFKNFYQYCIDIGDIDEDMDYNTFVRGYRREFEKYEDRENKILVNFLLYGSEGGYENDDDLFAFRKLACDYLSKLTKNSSDEILKRMEDMYIKNASRTGNKIIDGAFYGEEDELLSYYRGIFTDMVNELIIN